MQIEYATGPLLLGKGLTSWEDFASAVARHRDILPQGCVLSSGPDVLSALTGLTLLATLGGALKLSREPIYSSHGDMLVSGLNVIGDIVCRDPRSALVYIPTSGTTGIPKLAEHDLHTLCGRIRPRPGDGQARWLMTYHPASFAGVQVLLTTLLSGGSIIEPADSSLNQISEAGLEHGATHVSGTPTLWRGLLGAWKDSPPPLVQITLGGEASPQSLLDNLKEAFPHARIIHIYASTEAGALFAVTDGREGFPLEWLNSGIEGVQLAIKDSCLTVRSPRRMLRYADSDYEFNPDLWIDTGDMVEVIGDRVLFRGRRDSMINVGGTKVQPEEIENVLLQLSFVVDARVFGKANPISGSVLGADIVLVDEVDEAFARPMILGYMRDNVSPAKVPRVIRFVKSLERGLTQKKGRLNE